LILLLHKTIKLFYLYEANWSLVLGHSLRHSHSHLQTQYAWSRVVRYYRFRCATSIPLPPLCL